MAQIIQHNIMSLNAFNKLSTNSSNLSKNLEKLSSGFKINRAGDDAAGLAISEKMRSQITGLTKAVDNAQDGISLVQTAEGALTEVHSMLNRMVELATQAANGTYDNTDRQKLQEEVTSLKDEINRIAEETNFNGIKLLDGSMGSGNGLKTPSVTPGTAQPFSGVSSIAQLATAAATGDKVEYSFTYEVNGQSKTKTLKFEVTQGKATGQELTLVGNSSVKVTANANTSLAAASIAGLVASELAKDADFAGSFKITDPKDGSIAFEAVNPGADGAKILSGSGFTKGQDGLDAPSKIDFKGIGVANLSTAEAAKTAANHVFEFGGSKFLFINDTNAAKAGYEALGVSSDVTLIGVGGNAFDLARDGKKVAAMVSKKTGLDVKVSTGATRGLATNDLYVDGKVPTANGGLSLQIGDTASQRIRVKVENMGVANLGLSKVDISTENGANSAIDTINEAIKKVSTQRSNLGATQNRLEHTINNLTTTTENLTNAESRIRDTDMAKEMMAYTKNNVLAQAAQAMLAQANQQPQQILQLLR